MTHNIVETRYEHAIREAMRRGQTGFQGPAPSVFGSQVLSVVMGDAGDSVPWLVTLDAQTFQSGSVAPVGPINNSVQTAFTSPTNTAPGAPPEALLAGGYNLGGLYVRVYWGLGHAAERAYVDYPFGGTTFQLSGAFVRVEFPPGLSIVASANVPNYGGFVAPCVAGRNLTRPPTLTSSSQIIGGGAAISYPIPPRARGYRLYFGAAPPVGTGTNLPLQITQGAFQGFVQPVTFDDDSAWAFQGRSAQNRQAQGLGSLDGSFNAQDTSYQDLDPRAEYVTVTNPANAGAVNVNVGVVWQLDLS